MLIELNFQFILILFDFIMFLTSSSKNRKQRISNNKNTIIKIDQ